MTNTTECLDSVEQQMQTTDRTAGGRARTMRNALLAQTPPTADVYRSCSARTSSIQGQLPNSRHLFDGTLHTEYCCCQCPVGVPILTIGDAFTPGAPYAPTYDTGFLVQWSIPSDVNGYVGCIPQISSHILTVNYTNPSLVVYNGNTRFIYVYTNAIVDESTISFTLTIANECSSQTVTGTGTVPPAVS
jgi:hypothetical protein